MNNGELVECCCLSFAGTRAAMLAWGDGMVLRYPGLETILTKHQAILMHLLSNVGIVHKFTYKY